MNLKHRAMVIGEVAFFVATVRSHELDHLQSTLGAIDVGDVDVGFLCSIERSVVLKQSVGKDRGRPRILDCP